MKKTLTEIALVLASIIASLLLVMLALYLARYPAHIIFKDWFIGAIGSRFDIAVSLKNACPLILTGLAVGIAFRCGVINIGAEGQSILGSLAAAALATRLFPALNSPLLAIPLALLISALFGALWAAIAGLLDKSRGVPIVLSTILLNFIALFLLNILLEGPLKSTTTAIVQSDSLPAAYWLPTFPYTFLPTLHTGILLAIAIATIAWLIQSRTTFGFELLVTGLNPTTAKLAGIPVAARQLSVMLFSGAFAGLAGGIQLLGIEGHTLSDTSPNIGYAGIAVALLGRLHPAGIVLAALFFGFLDQGATHVETSQYPLPHESADIVKGIIVLVILTGTAVLARSRTTVKER